MFAILFAKCGIVFTISILINVHDTIWTSLESSLYMEIVRQSYYQSYIINWERVSSLWTRLQIKKEQLIIMYASNTYE